MNHYIEAWKKYAVFEGRESRSAYWYFVLFNVIATIILSMIDKAAGLTYNDQGLLNNIYGLAIALPSIGIAIRRMHDINKSGWFILIPIYSLILTLRKGTVGTNKYGPEPIATTSTVTPTPPPAPMA